MVLANLVGCQQAPEPPNNSSPPEAAPPPAALSSEQGAPPAGPSSGDPAGPQPVARETYRTTPEHTTFQTCGDLPPREEGRPAESVRTVDWCSRDYGGWVQLREGSQEMHEYAEMGGQHDTSIWKLVDVAYGDLDREGGEEAAVFITDENYGAQGGGWTGATVYVFRFEDGGVRQLARATGPYARRASLSIEGGLVRIHYDHEGKRCDNAWTLQQLTLELGEPSCS